MMRTSEDINVNKLSPFHSSLRISKFRLPFRQKTNLQEDGSSSSVSSPSLGSFFGLRKFGSKPVSPTGLQRKSVSFSTRARPLQAPDTMDKDWQKGITADHADVTYRQAVSRLRNILSPRAQTPPDRKSGGAINRALGKSFDSPPLKKDRLTSGLRSIFSKDQIADVGSPITPSPLNRSFSLNNKNYLPSYLQNQPQGQLASHSPGEMNMSQDDLFGFIDKQGAYINQLEKETKYCRDELGTMLDKVKDVITENEILHERQKGNLLSSMIQQLDEKTATYGHGSALADRSSGQSAGVIRDSRIAELEAQLSQAKRSLRLAQEEVLDIRRGGGKGCGSDANTSTSNLIKSNDNPACCDLHQLKVSELSREKDDLVETLAKIKQQVIDMKERESEAAKRVKNSLEIVEQMQMEKAESDMETRRLKEELERHQQRVREMIHDNSRKLQEEKLQVEKKYKQEIDTLNNEMNQEMDSITKLRLDLERQKRVETDLRREINQKMSMIDDLRNEMQIKISHFQAELSHCLMLKSQAEQELIGARLQAEKVERDGKHDCARLQSEITGLRKRLEQSDADLSKCQEVIVKLNGNISHLQREGSLSKMRMDEREVVDVDVSSIIRSMEDKHSRDMAELEQLLQAQNSLLDKLRNECKLVTEKLEETSRQNKKERKLLEAEKERLAKLNSMSQEKCVDLEQKVQYYSGSHDQLITRLHRLEEDDKTRSDRIFQLLSKQSGLLKENQNLQNEVSYLKSKSGGNNAGENRGA